MVKLYSLNLCYEILLSFLIKCVLNSNRTSDSKTKYIQVKNKDLSHPGWCDSVDRAWRTKGSLVRFPVRAHAWVAGQVPSRGQVRGNHTLMFLSSLFLPHFPSL